MSEITRILSGIEAGEELVPPVYQALRCFAARKMANETANHTIQPTALVREGWLKLVGGTCRKFQGRNHFFAAVAEAMRRNFPGPFERRFAHY